VPDTIAQMIKETEQAPQRKQLAWQRIQQPGVSDKD
jgi:hypothetical protein